MGATVAIPSLCLSIADAAFELGSSEDFIRALVSRKELPASKIGNKVLIRRDDLESLLDRRRIA